MVTIKSGTWFEVRYKYDKTTEDGMTKKATETSVFLAENFKDAYEKATEHLCKYMSGEFDVVSMKIAPYKDVVMSETDSDTDFYRVKVTFIVYEPDTDKEKKTQVNYLVQANSVDGARRTTDRIMTESLIDCDIESVSKTGILDVIID